MSVPDWPPGSPSPCEKLQSILESTPVHLFAKDCEGRYTMVNQSLIEATGIPLEAWIGRTLEEVFPGATGDHRGREQEVIRTGQPQRGTIEPLEITGKGRKWFQVDRAPLRNRGGEIIGVLCTVVDVTEREQALAAMKVSEIRFRFLFDHSTVGILFCEPGGPLLTANPAACRMLQRTADELRGARRDEVIDPADERIDGYLKERETHGIAQGEGRFIRGDGSRFPALATSAVFSTPSGPQAWIMFQDLSELNASEQLAHEFSQRLLEVREEEKRRLSAALHHELGSFAIALIAQANAAEEELRTGRIAEAQEALAQCHGLFKNSLARLKSLAVDLRPPDLDLLGLRATLRNQLKRLAAENHLEIRFVESTNGTEIPAQAATVLFRIVQESLTNVVRHAQASRVAVRLSTSGGAIRLNISDNGRGFELAEVAAAPGTHLGLTIMREMVAAQHGSFKLKSEPGRGTTIRVVIPQSLGPA